MDRFKVIDVEWVGQVEELPWTIQVWEKGTSDARHYKCYLFGEDPECDFFTGVGLTRDEAIEEALDIFKMYDQEN